MASDPEMRLLQSFYVFIAHDEFLRSEDLLNLFWRILRNLLIEINLGLKFLNKIFFILLPTLLSIWFVLWILDVDDLKGLQKYLGWWILFCLVIIALSQGLSALIDAKIN
jgi:hypothetical protein